MKINEITDENKSWAILSGIALTFTQEYAELVKSIETLLRVRHRSKYPALIDAIDRFRNRANDMLNADLPILNDPDLVSLKNEVHGMLDHLSQLEMQLV